MRTFFKYFFKGENPVNWAVVLASVCLGYIAWLHKPNDTVAIHYMLILSIISLIILSKLGFLAYSLSKQNAELIHRNSELLGMTIPRIVSYNESSGRNVFIATKSYFFTIGTFVTIVYLHHDKGGYEQPMCTGKIGHIQSESQLMQVYIDNNALFAKNKKYIKNATDIKESLANFKIYTGEIREEI